jgi:uncharacterized protein YjbI with pentapeptide repeats
MKNALIALVIFATGLFAGVTIDLSAIELGYHWILVAAIALVLMIIGGALVATITILVLRGFASARSATKITPKELAKEVNEVAWHLITRPQRISRRKIASLISITTSLATNFFALRLALTIATTAFVAVGGILGTVLLWRQITLLSAQNEKLERQTEIFDAEFSARRFSEILELNRLSSSIRTDMQNKQLVSDDLLVPSSPLHSKDCFPRAQKTETIDADTFIESSQELQLLRVAINNSLASTDRSSQRGQAHVGNVLATLMQTQIPIVLLKGASFEKANLEAFSFSQRRIEALKARHANLSQALVTDACIVQADLQNAQAQRTNFRGTTFFDVKFTGAELTGSNFRGGIFSTTMPSLSYGSKLSGVVLAATMGQVAVGGYRMVVPSADWQVGLDAYTDAFKPFDELQSKLLSNGSILDGWFSLLATPRDSHCAEAVKSFVVSTHDEAALLGQCTGAQLGVEIIRLYSRPSDGGSWARNNDFSGAVLHGAIFDEALLQSANFEGSQLQGASFRDAAVAGALSFKNADLSNADLRFGWTEGWGWMSKIDFTGTIMDGAIVDGVDFGHNSTLKKSALSKSCVCGDRLPKLNGEVIRAPTCSEPRDLLGLRCLDQHLPWRRPRKSVSPLY